MSYQDADAIVLLELCQQQVDSVAAPKLPEDTVNKTVLILLIAPQSPQHKPCWTPTASLRLLRNHLVHLSSKMPSASSKNVICRVAIEENTRGLET